MTSSISTSGSRRPWGGDATCPELPVPPLPIHGADVSMTQEVENLGGVYRDASGRARDLFELLAENMIDTVRLRLWLDPYDEAGRPYLGGTNDLAATIGLARRARAAGLRLMLDLHYSDFWTDPKKQTLPKAWRGLSFEELVPVVGSYTTGVLDTLAAEGLSPALVQVGNEITNGMLWPHGHTARFDDRARSFESVDPAADDRLAVLLRSGISAVRESSDAETVLHLDFGGANELYRGWFDRMTARGVDTDVIALSYYPFWHGTLAELGANLADVAARYDTDVLIAETAHPHTLDVSEEHHVIVDDALAAVTGYPPTPQGQCDFLGDLKRVVAGVPNGRGMGVVWWEPAWLPVAGTSWASPAGMAYAGDVAEAGNPWVNLTLFDVDGNVLPSLRALGAPDPSEAKELEE